MNNLNKEYEKIFKQIKTNAKVCIWGSNNIAEEIYDNIKTIRPDVQVKFFIDSEKSGNLKGLPLYKAETLDKFINEVDTGIIASFSARFYLELILRSFGLQNNIMISKKIVESHKEKKQVKVFDIEKSAKIFKTHKEREMYRFFAKARKNKQKYAYKIKKWYDKNHPNRFLVYATGHYYDFINKDAIQVAIDGGACNAIHSLMNLQQFPNCNKIYTFEPCYDSFKNDLIDKLIKNKPEIEIIEKALWKENTTLQFRKELDFKAASAILEVKPNIKRKAEIININAITLDSFVENNNITRVDYIKMDLENAEQQALEGAKKTLLKFRPQLAISIYHSDEQFYEIPVYLKNLLSNYEFRLGHYRQDTSETVLYAIPKELAKK